MGKKGKGKKAENTTDLKNDPDIVLATGDFTLPNGDTYSGEYCAHRLGVIWRQGHGIYTTHDGQIYEGEWADDKLIDNSELVINYPSGAEFHGRLVKNKYNGPGVYTLTNKLDISCQFANNQPQGEIALIDCNGNLWRGEAQKDQALLIAENIFYLILPEDRGKGVSRTPEYEIGSSCLGEEEEELDYPDEYWRDLIFAKSTKTDADIDFTDSEWYKCYKKFKRRKAEIESKIANDVGLEEEDSEWLGRFKQYKDQCRKREAEKALARKKSSEAAFDLNRRFESPEFLESCPEVKIFDNAKARQGGEEVSAESGSDSSFGEAMSQSKFDRSRLRSKVLVKKDVAAFLNTDRHNLPDILPLSTKIEAARQMEEMEETFLQCTDVDPRCFVRKQLVQFHSASRAATNELVCTFKPAERKLLRHATVQRLHFTKEREQLALQMRVQKILERKQADEDEILLFSQAKQMVGEMEALKKYDAGGVGTKSGDSKAALLTAIEESKTLDATIKSSFTNAMSAPEVVEDQEARVLRYINERVEQWQNEEDAKKKSRAEKLMKPPPLVLHVHSVGVDTDSLPDIPRDLLIRMTAERPHSPISLN